MRTAHSPKAGKAAGTPRRVARRRAAFAACVALAAALAGVAYVLAQAPAIPVVATVRHAPTLNGRVEGSVQMLTGEYLTLNGGGVVKGDLLVPGTPAVVRNGTPVYQGTIDGGGSAQPSNYQVTLNSGAEVRYVRRRVDPVTLAPVPVPPAPSGTRYVTVNSPGQSVGTWATVRNLTLNSNVGSYAVPAGTYGSFTANGGGSFVLGVAGATQAAVYNFEDITLNSLSNLNVVGPVVVNVANRVSVNSSCVVGSAANPRWLALNVSRYDVTINGGQLYGVVRAPSGSVTLSAATLKGEVACDRLTVNGGTIVGVTTDTTPPALSVTQPANGAFVKTATLTVAGTFTDESATTVKVNGVAASVSGNSFTATASLGEGANTITIVATDAAGNSSTAARSVTRDSAPPVITLAQPAEGQVTKNAQAVVSGTVADATATSVTVNGVTASINGQNFTASVPLGEGQNPLNVSASDAAGNTATLSRTIVRDSAAPAVTIVQPSENSYNAATQVIVSGTYADATATVVKVNGLTANISNGGFSATVPVAEGPNELVVTATDAAGNQSEARRHFTRDTTAPVLTVAQPADGTLTADEQVTFSGTFSDASPVTVNVSGVAATVTGNSFTAVVPLSPGPLLLIAHAVDAAGNETTVERKVTGVKPLSLSVESPEEGQKANAHEFHVTGTVAGTDVKVTVNGRPFDVLGGVIFGGYIDLPEGAGTVSVEATDALGRKQTVTRGVTVDTTPPAVTDISPAQDALVAETATAVSGRVSDASVVSVSVNDVEASVGADGTFTLAGFAVAEGENAFTVRAVDALGNRSVVQSSFRGKDRTPPPSVFVFPVPAETTLQLLQVEGRAEPGASVSIAGVAEPVAAEAAEGTGLFFATVKLAAGDNALAVSSTDKDGNASQPVVVPVRYDPNLTRPAGQPFEIHVSANDAQKALAGQELPRPLIVRVTDQSGDAVANTAVTFTAAFGGGSFVGGAGQVQAVTDAEGRAAARFVGGPEPGFQYVRADFAANPTKPVSFSAELLHSNPAAPTIASGVVLDQNMRALPNVLVRLGGQQARTGADGRFVLTNVPVGPHQVLELVGRDQIQLPGRWPNISYDLDVLPGVDNHLGRPLFLPRVNAGVEMPLDADGVVTRDTVYELPAVGGLPPVRVTARAGTHVQFPPDVTDKRLSVTRIPVNRTPMTLEDGRATNLYISVQPSGAIFEPALEVSFPNLDGLAPGSEVLLMSFDHDAGRYVKMGTGHVSADGRVVTSDAGSGIRVGAWHALPPDPPAKDATVLGYMQIEGNPAFEGRDVEAREAYVLSTRAVPYSRIKNSLGLLSRLLVRALVPMPGKEPIVEPVHMSADSTKPELEFDAGAFDYKTKELFIQEGKEIKLDVTVKNPLPNVQYTISCPKPPEAKQATVVCDDKTKTVTIKGSPLYTLKNNKPEFHAGSTEFTVQGLGASTKAEAKIKVSLVQVIYKEAKAISGFDDPVKDKIQDSTKVMFDSSNKFTGDVFKDDPDNDQNKTKDPWLTVVLNGDQNAPAAGGTQDAKYEVTPGKANDFLKFESDDTAKADVAGDTQNKKLTVTGKTADETAVKAKLTSYKADKFEVGTLNVVMRKRVKVNAAFFFLKYHSNEARLDPGSLNDYVKGINEILTAQTGIQYEIFRVYHWEAKKSRNFVPTPANNPSLLQKDFTDVISYADWDEIATGKTSANQPSTQPKLCDPNADREIYVVWEVEAGEVKAPNLDVVGVFVDTHGTIITDNRDDNTMAHEIGHSFYIRPADPAKYQYYNCTTGKANCKNDPAHSNVRRELMFATNSGRTGFYIPKADVDQAIKAGGSFDWYKGGFKKRACP